MGPACERERANERVESGKSNVLLYNRLTTHCASRRKSARQPQPDRRPDIAARVRVHKGTEGGDEHKRRHALEFEEGEEEEERPQAEEEDEGKVNEWRHRLP